ncbi:glycosyltransferase family 2 protein [Pseudohalioglobus sediminis]|uniref:Glycosyltransferase family 2 protein n=1 Tax=Pseudohalioglobus sediminis TaxID=2606449 RepID=A0A5B0WTZ1_9GAMM|nr:glycosyltransferase family 2 protein [Pseudohalioglobus sediminis]KAA1189948.1 glycosyltransferase family 2 protein [Pseudohalioglobus sediminis]
MKAKTIDVSILIVSWNTIELVDSCLSSIEEQIGTDLAVETILVDNASADGTSALVKENYPDVLLIENTENVGFANAVNQAAREASGRYFFLLNSDAKLLDRKLPELVSLMDADDSIGVASGALEGRNHRRHMPCRAFPSLIDLVLSYTVDCVYQFQRGKPRSGQRREVAEYENGTKWCETDWIPGCYMLVRRDLMDADGLLDHRIFMYYEDTLLCHKAWDRGYRVVSVDTACVYHHSGASARQISTTTTCHSYKSSRIYVESLNGPRTLWWYERYNRGVWRLFISVFFILENVGLREKAQEKRALFSALLNIPRLT